MVLCPPQPLELCLSRAVAGAHELAGPRPLARASKISYGRSSSLSIAAFLRNMSPCCGGEEGVNAVCDRGTPLLTGAKGDPLANVGDGKSIRPGGSMK
jgi:hypothetical protein